MLSRHIAPFQGFSEGVDRIPGALPRAPILRPFGAEFTRPSLRASILSLGFTVPDLPEVFVESLLPYVRYVWLLFTFVIGVMVGSFLNVCVVRLPMEKSLLWPGSRCGHCLQPVRWYDNIPLWSYLYLRGRCRDCGTTFSARYFV